jgi:adenosyl cobinamide kinase/adenosyl cobinamide phosphate guanylyltransferase
MKRIVCENNVTGDLNLQKLLQVMKDAVALVTKETGKGFVYTQKQLKANTGKETASFQM